MPQSATPIDASGVGEKKRSPRDEAHSDRTETHMLLVLAAVVGLSGVLYGGAHILDDLVVSAEARRCHVGPTL